MSIHLPTPDCWRLGVLFEPSTGVLQCEMTFALYDPDDVISPDPGGFAASVFGFVVSDLVPAADAAVAFDGIALEDVRTIPYGGATFAQTPTVGTYKTAVQGAPTSACIAVKRVTGNLGRSGRGRVYWPLFSAAWFSSTDLISGADGAQIVNALGTFHADVKGLLGTGDVGIISLQTGGAPRSPNGLFEAVTGYSVTDLHVDSQRRRLLGRGS